MSGLLYLSRADVSALLPEVTDQLDLVEDTYRSLAALCFAVVVTCGEMFVLARTLY